MTFTGAYNPTDTDGNKLHAHGGSILKAGDTWYWFGEKPRYMNWYFEGINCYSSPDLQNWRFEGTVLQASGTGHLSRSRVAYRPKVLYNEKTAKYVMFITECSAECEDGHLDFAVSDSIIGPYTYVSSCYGAGGRHIMDMTVFKDDDGQAYVFYSANTDGTGHWVDRLSSDYLSIVSNASHPSVFQREAPCVFKMEGRYYLYFSDCTGWYPNQGYYVTAASLEGPWSQEETFGDSTTCNSQGTCIFAVSGAEGTTFVYAGDRWNGGGMEGPGDPCDFEKSEYLWLPIKVKGPGLSLDYMETWRL